MRMSRLFMLLLAVFSIAVLPVIAQNNASNKAFFAKTNGVSLAPLESSCDGFDDPVKGAACSDWIKVLELNDVIKTSSVGALEAAVSMECALWTYNTVTATSGGGKQTSSARAGVQVRVIVDGNEMEPGPVVFCDRVQATGLQVDTVCGCTVPGTTCECTVNDEITLELFQRTKNANSFHYFLGPLDPILHDVRVEARAIVACYKNGVADTCPSGTLDAYQDAKTAAAIGKATIVLEEHNNWGKQ